MTECAEEGKKKKPIHFSKIETLYWKICYSLTCQILRLEVLAFTATVDVNGNC